MKGIQGGKKLIPIRFFRDIHRWKLGAQDLLEHLPKGRIILNDQCLVHGDPSSFPAGLWAMDKISGKRGKSPLLYQTAEALCYHFTNFTRQGK
jgi:hypothetical protein